MSEWYEPNGDDIDIDHEDHEVAIFVKADDNGRIYLSLSFDQIKKISALVESDKTSAGDYVLVPREPTQQILSAIEWQIGPGGKTVGTALGIYQAMLAAAPSPCHDKPGAGWMPIETAPKDIPILVTDGKVIVVLLIGECGQQDYPDPVGCDGYDFEWDFDWKDVTHWMPLPEAPNTKPQGG
jgi:hypothetical protein